MADEIEDVVKQERRLRGRGSPIGLTGLNRHHRDIDEEWHRNLRGRRAAQVYREMRDNDSIIGATLYMLEEMVQTASRKVVPEGDSSAQKEAAEFVESSLKDMRSTEQEFTTEALSMLPFGYSYFEVTFKRRRGLNARHDDGKIGWKDIAIRAQETNDGWEFDKNGEILGMYQQAPPNYKRVFLPMEKCLLFRTRSRKNNPEGVSLLRTAYRAWHFLKNLQEFEAIGMERDLAGLVKISVPPRMLSKDASDEDKEVLQALQKLAKRVRRNSVDGIVFPAEEVSSGSMEGTQKTGFKFELVSASNGDRGKNISEVISRYEHRIAMSALSQFLLLGSDSIGSFALSSDQTDLFSIAVQGHLGRISSVLNRRAIPDLCRVNGIPSRNWPHLEFGDIDKPEASKFTAAIQQMVMSKVITPDDPLEAYMRELLGLPIADSSTAREIPSLEPQPDPIQKPVTNGAGSPINPRAKGDAARSNRG